jgi:hypothetical protein
MLAGKIGEQLGREELVAVVAEDGVHRPGNERRGAQQ